MDHREQTQFNIKKSSIIWFSSRKSTVVPPPSVLLNNVLLSCVYQGRIQGFLGSPDPLQKYIREAKSIISDISVLYEIHLTRGCILLHIWFNFLNIKYACSRSCIRHDFGVILIKYSVASGGTDPCFRDHLYIQTPSLDPPLCIYKQKYLGVTD